MTTGVEDIRALDVKVSSSPHLDHYILALFPPNPQAKRKERSHEALGIFKK